jgi:hypothetical protein
MDTFAIVNSAVLANKLYLGWAKGKKELKIWPRSAHGVDILDNKKATDFTIARLREIFRI